MKLVNSIANYVLENSSHTHVSSCCLSEYIHFHPKT